VLDANVTAFAIENQALVLFDPVSLSFTSTSALPANGKFTSDFTFQVRLNGAATTTTVNVTATAQSNNTTPQSLVTDINAALATAGLDTKLVAALSGTKLAINVIDPTIVSAAISGQSLPVFGATTATVFLGSSLPSLNDAPADGRLGSFYSFRLSLNGTLA